MCYNADNAMSHSPFLLLNGATQYYLQMFHFICSAIILFKIKDTSEKYMYGFNIIQLERALYKLLI